MSATVMTDTIEETARELHAAGINVVPVMADGSKRPAGTWKQWQHQPQLLADLDGWPAGLGLGIITGAVSGNLEMLEAEGRAVTQVTVIAELAAASGLADLWARINTGWVEQSPSGGYHWFYRVAGVVPGNTKIAAQADNVVLIETRGEGGFVVAAPTNGTAHATGQPWIRLIGSPATLPTLTGEEREMLHILFATLDQRTPTAPDATVAATWTGGGQARDGDVKPGDDYETRTDWAEILTPHGWTLVTARGRERLWRRPGKSEGISASTGHADDRERLYVWTSSTPFTPETPYTKFGAYTLLNHHGDHTAAARALNADGYGRRAERPLTIVPTATATPETDGTAALAPAVVAGTPQALTDKGNADLLAARHSRRLRYIIDAGKWASWTGSRWQWEHDDGVAIQAAIETIRAIPDDSPVLHKHVLRSLNLRPITAAVRIARTDPQLIITADQFDALPNHLNTPAGVIDLTTGELTTPHPTLFHTKQTGVRYDPAQPTPRWKRFLDVTFGGDKAMIRYVQQLAGVTAVGTVTSHVLPFLHGSGGNGKSVFLETLLAVLGDYAIQAPNDFLLAGRQKHETELARLQGRRLVIASEINRDSRFDEAKVKMLTGGDRISARFMRQDFFEFTPTHTLWLMGNHQPKVESGGESFWRRLRLIPFLHKIQDRDKVENLQGILTAEEGAGILAWVVAGALDVAREGLQEPPQVRAATQQYEQEEDHLARFITDRIHVGGGNLARVDTSEIRTAYGEWCREQGETELNGTAFGREFRMRVDTTAVKSNGRRFYTNVQLYAVDETTTTTVWNDR